MSSNPFQDNNTTGKGGFGLDELDDEWNSTDGQRPQGEVPDGQYTVKVERVELASTKTGKPMLKWQLRVLKGEQEGRVIFKNSVISRNSLSFLKGDLETCALSLKKLSDLEDEDTLGRLLDVALEVKKTTKGEFSNVYFNGRIEQPDANYDRGNPPGDEDDSDVPF